MAKTAVPTPNMGENGAKVETKLVEVASSDDKAFNKGYGKDAFQEDSSR